jgi:hypothetical protein
LNRKRGGNAAFFYARSRLLHLLHHDYRWRRSRRHGMFPSDVSAANRALRGRCFSVPKK